jgi:hypothetical protein
MERRMMNGGKSFPSAFDIQHSAFDIRWILPRAV